MVSLLVNFTDLAFAISSAHATAVFAGTGSAAEASVAELDFTAKEAQSWFRDLEIGALYIDPGDPYDLQMAYQVGNLIILLSPPLAREVFCSLI